MTLRLPALPLAASLLLLCPAAFATVRPHHHGTHAIVRRSASTHSAHVSHFIDRAASGGISPERATEIQSALIQHGYLTGEASGTWDANSVAAMQKMQSDNGWQTKFVPDSRALIKLGLGAGSTSTASSTPAAAGSTASVELPSTGQTF